MARIIEFFDGADSALTPVIGNISASKLVEYPDDATYEAGNLGSPLQGDIYFNTTDKTVRYYDSTQWIEVGRQIDIEANTADISDIRTTTGTSDGDLNMGTYPGYIIGNGGSTKQNIEDLETQLIQNIDDIQANTDEASAIRDTLGTSNGDTSMGTYSGNIISDDVDQSTINQELENAIESVPAGLTYQGNWDADTNTPTLVSSTGTGGHYYRVSVAGTTSLDGISDWEIGDWAVFTDTGVWQKVDNSDTVTSVFGRAGSVVAETNDYTWSQIDKTTSSIDDITDVDTSTVAPVVDDVLKWDGTDWVPGVGGGSGVGGINYILDDSFNFEGGTVGDWVLYKDVAGTEPVDGIGGSPVLASFSAAASTLLRGSYLGNFNKLAGNAQGEGISVDFTIDDADLNQALYISFDLRNTSAGYVTDDMLVYVYDVTNAVLTPVSRSGNSSRFTGRFNSGDSNDYRLILHVASTNSSAWNIQIDNVKVGPDSIVDAPIIGDWIDFTPTGSWITNTTYSGKYRRVGDSAEIIYSLLLTGAPTATSLLLEPPSGLNWDSSKIDEYTNAGSGNIIETGIREYVAGARWNSTPQLVVIHTESNNSGVVNATAPVTFASGDILSIHVEAPIEEYNSSAVLSTTEMMNTTVKARYTSASTAAVPNSGTVFDFSTKEYDTHNAVSGSGTGWKFTVPKTGYYNIKAGLVIDGNGVNRFDSRIYVDGVPAGKGSFIAIQATSTATSNIEQTFYLQKDQYFAVAHAETGPGASTYSSGGQYIEIIEQPDFSVYSVYGETDTIEIQGQPFSYPTFTAGVAQIITSFTFPSTGEWDVTTHIGHRVQAATLPGATDINTKLDTSNSTNINLPSALVFGKNGTVDVFNAGVTFVQSSSSFTQTMNITDTSQTYYLRHVSGITTGISNLRLDFYSILGRKIK